MEDDINWDDFFEMMISPHPDASRFNVILQNEMTCVPCGLSFSSVMAVKIHVLSHPKVCFKCGKVRKSGNTTEGAIALNYHYQKQHGIDFRVLQFWVVRSDVSRFPCPFCGRVFEKTSEFYGHFPKLHSRYCSLCFSKIKHGNGLTRHIKHTHGTEYLALTHGAEYLSSGLRQAKENNPDEEPVQSTTKTKSRPTDMEEENTDTRKGSRTRKKSMKYVNEITEFKNMSVVGKRSLEQEEEVITESKRHFLDNIKDQLEMPKTLERNIFLPETKKIDSSNFLRSICYICEQNFPNFSTLSRHWKKLHPQQCVFCLEFYTKKGMHTHIGSIHNMRRKKISEFKGFEFCSLCLVVFSNFEDLRTHALELHPRSCPECWITFNHRVRDCARKAVNTHYAKVHSKGNVPVGEDLQYQMFQAAEEIKRMRRKEGIPENPLEYSVLNATFPELEAGERLPSAFGLRHQRKDDLVGAVTHNKKEERSSNDHLLAEIHKTLYQYCNTSDATEVAESSDQPVLEKVVENETNMPEVHNVECSSEDTPAGYEIPIIRQMFI